MNWVEQIELQKTQQNIQYLPSPSPSITPSSFLPTTPQDPFFSTDINTNNTNQIELLQKQIEEDKFLNENDLTQIQKDNDTIADLYSMIDKDDIIINNQYQTIQNDKNDILQMILDQNRLLEQKNQNINDNQTTDNQKNYYMNQNLVYYANVNSYLFLFYFLLIIIISYITIYSIRMNNYMKIATIVGFILFPFVIYDIEVWVFRILRYFYYFANGKVYTHIDL
jgi:hypothetical protein